jgi:hypothetical protein
LFLGQDSIDHLVQDMVNGLANELNERVQCFVVLPAT